MHADGTLAAGSLLSLCLAGVAQAQIGGSGPDEGSSDAAYIDEIIVTARHRAEPLQDVPISVSVVTGRFDLILTVMITRQFTMLNFYTEEVAKLDNVRAVETFVVYKSFNLKIPMMLPL